MSNAVPNIITWASDDAPPEWRACARFAVRGVRRRPNGKFELELLPIFFMAPTIEAARQKAIDFWKAEQDKLAAQERVIAARAKSASASRANAANQQRKSS